MRLHGRVSDIVTVRKKKIHLLGKQLYCKRVYTEYGLRFNGETYSVFRLQFCFCFTGPTRGNIPRPQQFSAARKIRIITIVVTHLHRIRNMRTLYTYCSTYIMHTGCVGIFRISIAEVSPHTAALTTTLLTHSYVLQYVNIVHIPSNRAIGCWTCTFPRRKRVAFFRSSFVIMIYRCVRVSLADGLRP